MKRTLTATLCAIPFLTGALLDGTAAQAAPPVHAVKGGATFFLETGAKNNDISLILHYRFNVTLDEDGFASGSITSTINSKILPATGGHPDPFGTGDPVRYAVLDLEVIGNEALITAVVVFAPDFPEEIGTIQYFDVLDVGDPPDAGDLVSIDGFGPLVVVAGNIDVW
jgi:hypothetical protein